MANAISSGVFTAAQATESSTCSSFHLRVKHLCAATTRLLHRATTPPPLRSNSNQVASPSLLRNLPNATIPVLVASLAQSNALELELVDKPKGSLELIPNGMRTECQVQSQRSDKPNSGEAGERRQLECPIEPAQEEQPESARPMQMKLWAKKKMKPFMSLKAGVKNSVTESFRDLSAGIPRIKMRKSKAVADASQHAGHGIEIVLDTNGGQNSATTRPPGSVCRMCRPADIRVCAHTPHLPSSARRSSMPSISQNDEFDAQSDIMQELREWHAAESVVNRVRPAERKFRYPGGPMMSRGRPVPSRPNELVLLRL
ncbi:hypothetical protein BDU57DRAFT_534489 [Ampelomyces quisqualis]|uniref:Uncharacterized protein n=1 Tax=Ampelomyces quisqualis TaxID=50730 RepID=A0A6A5QZS5_AMPQU|nr:hypothetical protein BDU57DRAFT_534489 [Ampelomyces quisqualis]